MATKKRSTNVPAGFKEVDNSLSGFWKPSADGESLQGIVGHMIEARNKQNENGKPNRFFAIRLTASTTIMDTSDKMVPGEEGDLVGVGGAVLVSFLADQIGKEVFLVYKGLGRAKRGQNAPKLYATYAKEYDGETGEVIPQ
jgi:hypothetical protein